MIETDKERLPHLGLVRDQFDLEAFPQGEAFQGFLRRGGGRVIGQGAAAPIVFDDFFHLFVARDRGVGLRILGRKGTAESAGEQAREDGGTEFDHAVIVNPAGSLAQWRECGGRESLE